MKVGTIFSSSRVNPRLSWVAGHVSTIRACVHGRTRAHTPAEVAKSDPLATLVIASVVSGEGRGGRDRDRSRKYVRTVDERGKKRGKCVERTGETMSQLKEKRIDKLID